MKILLITMPWASLDMPSIQLGILKSVVDVELPNTSCEILYANLLWAEYIYEKSEGRIDRSYNYPLISESNFTYGVGDWIFTKALYGEEYRRDEYVNFILQEGALTRKEMNEVEWMYDQAPQFIDWLVENYINVEYDLIGFTSSFMQNIASLAVAKNVKNRFPQTKILFGGANCDDKQGEALHRNYPYVDYVIRGEGEVSLVELIKAIASNDSINQLGKISGLCYRKDGKSIVNPMLPQPLDFNNIPYPYYDDYYQLLPELKVSDNIHPHLVLETSRGCWWGAKHQCTFCGLNGSYIGFRSQPADKAYDMITTLVERHQIIDVFMVDNILDTKYMRDLLPRLAALPWDLHIFYEVKANLMEEQIRLFHEAGIKKIQPGIESLSSEVLKIMDKGITGIQNVQLLKFCEQYSITVTWNLLYGFPQEKWEHYDVKKMQYLTHFQPPGGANRISLERFSPYYQNPDMGLLTLGPAKFYELVYQLPQVELMDMAYIFESNEAGLNEEQANIIRDNINEWQLSYAQTDYYYRKTPDGGLYFYDTRGITERTESTWNDPLHVAIHDELKTIKTLTALDKKLRTYIDDERLNEVNYLNNFLQMKTQEGYFYEEDGKYLSLAIPYDAQRIRSNRYLEFMREEQ